MSFGKCLPKRDKRRALHSGVFGEFSTVFSRLRDLQDQSSLELDHGVSDIRGKVSRAMISPVGHGQPCWLAPPGVLARVHERPLLGQPPAGSPFMELRTLSVLGRGHLSQCLGPCSSRPVALRALVFPEKGGRKEVCIERLQERTCTLGRTAGNSPLDPAHLQGKKIANWRGARRRREGKNLCPSLEELPGVLTALI